MKSIALKTNNPQTIEYLEHELENFDIDNCYFSCKNFKHYTNIIIHYKGNDENTFINKISNLLSFLVIYEFEEDFLKHLIFSNYFYFSRAEKDLILNNCFDIMVESDNYLKNKFNLLSKTFNDYITDNNRIFLNGFINFRLQKYIEILNSVVDDAVNSYIIEKEYQEFISLLRLYINSQNTIFNDVHIIYSKNYTLILDDKKNIIENSKENLSAKFLSDISFSTNDLTLNTLLNILPSRIFIHLIDNTLDEFIKTLKLIFEQRVNICTDCNLCNLYRNTRAFRDTSF